MECDSMPSRHETGCVAGVVVLFYPPPGVLDNIRTYIDEIDRLYVIDNTEGHDLPWAEDLRKIEKVVYVPNFKNLGVACALNQAAQMAISEGYKWLLTMDQDSAFATSHPVGQMLRGAEGCNKVAIVAPKILTEGLRLSRPGTAESDFSVVGHVITSGSLLNLGIYSSLGGFREDYFIDSVDDEYCLRARQKGYVVVRANYVYLSHQWAKSRKHLGKVVAHYSPIRYYYIFRNCMETVRMYRTFDFNFAIACRRMLLGYLFKIVLFEKEKIRKLRMAWLGYRHFRERRFGKFPGNIVIK